MFNLQVSNIMDNLEEVTEPVSPSGRYFNSSIICAYVFGFLESEVPINDSQTMYLLKHVFLPINPRFSSIMVRDKHGKMMWKKVEVRPEDHIKFPIFPKNESSEFYDQYFDEYVSKIMMERTPQEKPLWEIHMIKYPTSNAAGTLIFKLHHALGDGYSLMGALLSCLQRADDPSLPLSFPSRKSSESPPPYEKGFFKWFPSTIFSFFKSISDFGWSIAKSSMIEDDKTPIRNGDEGVEFQPSVLSNISFSLDHIKQIKSKLGVAVAKHMYGTLRNSSVVMSNLIGPVEPMALANHPVKGLYFTMTGGPESINIAVMSYTRVLRVTLKTQKGFIDEQKFKFCMVKAFEDISKAATEVPNKSKG
ncbi:wax ester synthase/diacylglycerol acyltransferase 11-like isoform X2 [Gastrolobium bilobum]|uniref:wax ester synthase/diacylglycerol acyltransferase 11-like isoform X2 n=1 Tax=Gastrolobium bilobum TaxID=150636 RepID=UPI002AAF2501|nr:wax ester synthase/diacylglycerol acyltransferase 11-like isoform X2 [Gastrolobium bilobum]